MDNKEIDRLGETIRKGFDGMSEMEVEQLWDKYHEAARSNWEYKEIDGVMRKVPKQGWLE